MYLKCEICLKKTYNARFCSEQCRELSLTLKEKKGPERPENDILSRDSIRNGLQSAESKTEQAITGTENNGTSHASDGQTVTETDNSKHNEPTMQNTETDFEESSMMPVADEIQPAVYIEQSSSASMVRSESLSLLDDTATHLHDLMKGMIGNKPTANIQSYHPEMVNAACNCAKNIREIMKLKLEAIKFQKELNR